MLSARSENQTNNDMPDAIFGIVENRLILLKADI